MHHWNLHISHNMIEYSMQRIAWVPAKISCDEVWAEGAVFNIFARPERIYDLNAFLSTTTLHAGLHTQWLPATPTFHGE
jgi:hypothetical protein